MSKYKVHFEFFWMAPKSHKIIILAPRQSQILVNWELKDAVYAAQFDAYYVWEKNTAEKALRWDRNLNICG